MGARLLVSAIVLASFGTACTALVFGKVSETDDYKVGPAGASTAAPGEVDKCALLNGDSRGGDRDANACATCIATNCADDVTYACNAGPSTSPRPWFRRLEDCAKNPWKQYRPPTEPSGFYECQAFETPKEEISDDGGPAEREPRAHNCVNKKCLQGGVPPCKQCDVYIAKSPADSTKAFLRDDTCGRCLVEHCQASIVKCCDTGPMNDFVERCAFTNSPSNKAACLELGNVKPDSGGSRYDEVGTKCLTELSECFRTNCSGKGGCR